MTDVSHETLTSFHISTYTPNDLVLQLARDYVKGHHEDYYFFQFDEDEYVLVFSEHMDSPMLTDCSATDCSCIVFKVVTSDITEHEAITLDGTISEVGTNPSVDTVNITGTVGTTQTVTYIEQYYVLSSSLHIYNSEYVAYGSISPQLGKLNEGVEYYAFANMVLSACCILFVLVDRIFSRISRNR